MGILQNSELTSQEPNRQRIQSYGGDELMKKVLFVCVENAGRSQMAEAIARAYGIDATSAGTMPVPTVNPTVIEVMRERGFDLSSNKPKMLTSQMIEDADYIVTMGCKVESICPKPLIVKMDKKLIDWQIDDPKDKPIEEVKKIRSQIENQVSALSMKSISADMPISAAKRDELPEILALLEECELPKEGLVAHLSTTLVARKGGEIVGCSALELYGEFALLRSVAVKAPFRKRGVGLKLTRAALDLAKHYQVTNVYLLTMTASTFFSKIGFVRVQRSDVPENIQRSAEFTTLCPDTATAMTMSLAQYNRF
jgi:protein-tyrosine-phosphatase/N-acetylglutamate synthase-like GNAT family acetyltransferase